MGDNIDSDEFILELNVFLGKIYVNEEKGIPAPEDLEGREVPILDSIIFFLLLK